MQVGNLELNLLLNRNQFDQTLKQAERDAKLFQNMPLTIEPKINTQSFKSIGTQVKTEINSLNRWLNINPITPQVDLSQLEKVHDLTGMTGGTIRIEAEVKSKSKGDSGCCDNLERVIVSNSASIQELLKEIADNTKKDGLLKSGLKSIIGNTFGATLKGGFLGLGQQFSKEISKQVRNTSRGREASDSVARVATRVGESGLNASDNFAELLFGASKIKGHATETMANDIVDFVESIINPEILAQKSTAIRKKIFELATKLETKQLDTPLAIADLSKSIFSAAPRQIKNAAYRTAQVASVPARLNKEYQNASAARLIEEFTSNLERARRIIAKNPESKEIAKKKNLLIDAGGFERKKGESSQQTSEMLRPFFGDDTAFLEVKNPATDKYGGDPKSKTYDIAKQILEPLGVSVDGEIKSMLSNLEVLIGNSFSGMNPDSVRMATIASSVKTLFPDLNVSLAGFSGGGYIVEQAISILEALGDLETMGIGIGTPLWGLTETASPDRFKSVLGYSDPQTFALDKDYANYPEIMMKALIKDLKNSGMDENMSNLPFFRSAANVEMVGRNEILKHDVQSYIRNEESYDVLSQMLSGMMKLPKTIDTKNLSPELKEKYADLIPDLSDLEDPMFSSKKSKVLMTKIAKGNRFLNVKDYPEGVQRVNQILDKPQGERTDRENTIVSKYIKNSTEQFIKTFTENESNLYEVLNFNAKKLADSIAKNKGITDTNEIEQLNEKVANFVNDYFDSSSFKKNLEANKQKASLILDKASSQKLEQYNLNTDELSPIQKSSLASFADTRQSDDIKLRRGLDIYKNGGSSEIDTNYEFFNFANPAGKIDTEIEGFRQYITEPISTQLKGTDFENISTSYARLIENIQAALARFVATGEKIPDTFLVAAEKILATENKLEEFEFPDLIGSGELEKPEAYFKSLSDGVKKIQTVTSAQIGKDEKRSLAELNRRIAKKNRDEQTNIPLVRVRDVVPLGKGQNGTALLEQSTNRVIKLPNDKDHVENARKAISTSFPKAAPVADFIAQFFPPPTDPSSGFPQESENITKAANAGLTIPLPHEQVDGYMMMDLVEGTPLSKLASSFQGGDPRAIIEFINGLIKAGDLLRQFHDAGFAHRDLHPDNVMIKEDGSVAPIDFGSMQELPESGGERNIAIAEDVQRAIKYAQGVIAREGVDINPSLLATAYRSGVRGDETTGEELYQKFSDRLLNVAPKSKQPKAKTSSKKNDNYKPVSPFALPDDLKPDPQPIAETNNPLVPLHQTTNARLDDIINLLMGNTLGEPLAIPEVNLGNEINELVRVGDSSQEPPPTKSNLAQKSVNTSIEVSQNAMKSVITGIFSNFENLYSDLKTLETRFLRLDPSGGAQFGKKILQYSAVPMGAAMGAQGIPGIEQAFAAIHSLTDLGFTEIAQGLSFNLMEAVSRTMPDFFAPMMDKLSGVEMLDIGSYVQNLREVPQHLVDAIAQYTVGNTGRAATDIASGAAMIKGGKDAAGYIANKADSTRTARLEQQEQQRAIDAGNDSIRRADNAIKQNKIPGDRLDPNSPEITAELGFMKLEQSASEAADKLKGLFSTEGLRRLAPMVGIPTTTLAGSKPIKSARKDDIATTIARMGRDVDIERAIGNASPKMFLKQFQDMGKIKPEIDPEIFENLKRYWHDALKEINDTPLSILDAEEAIATLERFSKGYVNLLNDKELTGKQRSSTGSLHGQADELKSAIQAFSQFENIEDLSEKFQKGASNAGKHWGNTTSDILKQFRILSGEAKDKGYDIQRFISEGSPGPTEKIRRHWLRTTKYLLQQIGAIQSSARTSGSDIQKAFDDDAGLGAGLDRVQDKLLGLQNLLANELDGNITIGLGGNGLEEGITQFLADKLAAIESIESGKRPDISTVSNNSALLRLESGINRNEAQRLQRAKQLQQIHRATASHRLKEAKRLAAEEERMRRVAQMQGIHRATANYYAAQNSQEPSTEHLSEQLSWLEKLRQKAQEIHQYLFTGEQPQTVANDPLQVLDNAYQIYSNTIDNAPNSSDIFDGIKKFTDDMSARSPIFKNILDFGKDVGISTVGLLSFNYLADSISRIGTQTILAGRDLQRFKIQMEGIGKSGEFVSEDIFERSQGLGSQYLTSRTGYQRFIQATQGLGNDEIVDPIFQGFQKAFAARQSTADQQTRGYTAIEQIFSKGGLDGSVQSEELKGQLSEALSGSYGVAAKVRGQTPKEFAEDMKKAQVEAADLLIRMSAFYEVDSEILLRINSTSFDAELNRLQNNLAKIQEETGENLLPVGKLGLQATNAGLDLLSENFALVSTVSGGIFLMFITKMALSMYEVVKQTKLGTLAIKAFGIEAFQAQVRSQGLAKTTGSLAASSIGSAFKTLALPTAGAVALDLGYKTFTEGKGKRSTIEALDVIENLDISEEERTERRSGFSNSVYNPYALIKMAGRKNTQINISQGIEEAENVLAQIQKSIDSVEFGNLKSEFDGINAQIQVLQAQRINLVENNEIEQVGNLDKQLGELNKQKKNVLEDLTLGLVKTSNIENALTVFGNDLEDLKLQFGEDYYNRVKQLLGNVGDETKNKANQINEAIEALNSNAVVAIRKVTRSISDANFSLDLELSQQTIANIDQRLAGVLSDRTLEIANTQAQLTNQQGITGNLQQNRKQLETDILKEPNIEALRTSFKVSDNDELFAKLAQTSPDTISDKIENSKTAPDLAKSLELAQNYVNILQQENQALVNVKSTQLELVSKNREYAKSLYEFGSSLRDFSRSLEDMDIEKRRFEEDFPLQVSNAARTINRNARNLEEQYKDFVLGLERSFLQTQSEIADLEKQISNTKANTELLKQFTPGSIGFGREITQLFDDYTSALSSDVQKSLDIDLSRLGIEEQTLQNSRQIRNLAEQRVDFEIERLEQVKNLNRQQEDFNRQQQRSFEDSLQQFHNIELQASEMGVSLDLTAEQVAQQGNGLVDVLNQLSKKLQMAGDNLLSRQGATSSRDAFPIAGLTPDTAKITSGFGWRNIFGRQDFHEGIDIAATGGTEVVATNSGTVKKILPLSDQMQVGIQTAEGVMEWFIHLGKNLKVKPGDHVLAGQSIGQVAHTSKRAKADKVSTGDHLDYRVTVDNQWTNPKTFLESVRAGTHSRFKKPISPASSENFKNVALPQSKLISTNYGNTIDISSKVTPALKAVSSTARDAATEVERLQSLLEVKSQLQIEQQEVNEENALFNLIENLANKKLEIEEYYRDLAQNIEDKEAQIFRTVANAKGYLSNTEQIQFSGEDIRREYNGQILEIDKQQRELQRRLKGNRDSLVKGGKLDLLVKTGNEDAIAAKKIIEQQILDQVRALSNLESIKINLEANVDLAVETTIDNKALELDFQKRSSELGMSSELLDLRTNLAPSFIHDLGFNSDRRNLGEAEIKLDYERQLKELEQYRGEVDELGNVYERLKGSLDELNQAKLDNLAKETNSLVQIFDEVAQPALNGLLDDFIDNSTSAADAWNNFAQSILLSMADILMAYAKNEILRQLFGNEVSTPGVDISGKTQQKGGIDFTQILNTGIGAASSLIQPDSNNPTITQPQGGGILNSLLGIGSQVASFFFRDGGDTSEMYIPHASLGLDTKDISLARGIKQAMAAEAHPEAFPAILHKGEVVMSDLTGDAQLVRSLRQSGEWQRIKAQGIQRQTIPNYRLGSEPAAAFSGGNSTTTVNNYSSVEVHAKDARSFAESEDQIYYQMNLKLKQSKR